MVDIETRIHIANHIIASENYRFPKDNADSFTVLVEQGIVPAAEKDHLTAMARFRNRLVHLYWSVENERVHEYLQGSLDDLERFEQAVARHPW